jgi:type IV pilus assembly protein PilC
VRALTMAMFAYKAMNTQGRMVSGRMDAANPVDLEMRLRRMQLDFITGSPLKHAQPLFGKNLPRSELINFSFHLEQLVRAGVPLIEALADLRDSTEHPRMRETVASLVEGIEGGCSLSQAMTEHPAAFGQVFCALVRAGELTGNLAEVLREQIEAFKWEDELLAQTRRLLTYPAIVGAILLCVIAVLMLVVVPDLARFFRNTGLELPLQTRILMGASACLQAWWPAMLMLIAAAATGTVALLRCSLAARRRFDRLKLSLPVIGPVLHKVVLSRFASLFAMMYGAGIPITDAIRTAEEVVGNEAMRDALARSSLLIRQGQNVTAAFQGVALFPPLVVRMLRVGESTGALDQALREVSYFYTRDVRESIARAQASMEPILTLLLGLLLMAVAFAVLDPVYNMLAQLKT